MLHFFERMERNIDFQREYEKAEHMVLNNGYPASLEYGLKENFLQWRNRGNYTSFQELRETMGLQYSEMYSEYHFVTDVNMEKYFLYCEMMINLVYGLMPFLESFYANWNPIFDTMKYNISKAGFEIKTIDDKFLIVAKNAAAFEIADYIPEIADAIVEYNHYLLRGKLTRKKELLKKIADAMEPKRSLLNGIDKSKTTDFFNFVNNMNIRHNNIDPVDASNYKQGVAKLDNSELEKYYDVIYQLALTLFMLLEHAEEKTKIDEIKCILDGRNE